MRLLLDLIIALLPRLFDPFIEMIKLEFLKIYVRGIDNVRQIFIVGLLALFGIMLTLVGFTMIHIALFLLMPWSPQTNALILLGLGSVYFLVPLIFILKLASRKAWMKASGAEKLAGE